MSSIERSRYAFSIQSIAMSFSKTSANQPNVEGHNVVLAQQFVKNAPSLVPSAGARQDKSEMGLVFSKRRIHSDSGAKLSRGFLQLTTVHEDQSMHEMEMS